MYKQMKRRETRKVSHTYEGNAGTLFHFNSDHSGLITIETPEGGVKVPAKDIYEFLINCISNHQIDFKQFTETMQNWNVIKLEVHNEDLLVTRRS